jgi:hypothetical protein
MDKQAYQIKSNQIMTSSPGSGSNNLYVVLENGELYPKIYSTYDAARAAALHNHAELLEEERAECAEWGGAMCSKVDVEENKETGTTTLYVEKEIYITIQRYTVEASQ